MKIVAVNRFQIIVQPCRNEVLFFASLLADKHATSYTHFHGMYIAIAKIHTDSRQDEDIPLQQFSSCIASLLLG